MTLNSLANKVRADRNFFEALFKQTKGRQKDCQDTLDKLRDELATSRPPRTPRSMCNLGAFCTLHASKLQEFVPEDRQRTLDLISTSGMEWQFQRKSQLELELESIQPNANASETAHLQHLSATLHCYVDNARGTNYKFSLLLSFAALCLWSITSHTHRVSRQYRLLHCPPRASGRPNVHFQISS